MNESIWLDEFRTAHATSLLDAYVYLLNIETNLLEPVLKNKMNLWHIHESLVIKQVITQLTKKIKIDETLHINAEKKIPLAQHKYVKQTKVLYNLSEYDSKTLISNKCDALRGHHKIKCHIISQIWILPEQRLMYWNVKCTYMKVLEC